MNKLLVLSLLFLIFFSKSLFANPSIVAKTAILVDFDSDEILYELEPDMQKSKWVLEKGFLDMEVERVEIKNKLYNILSIFTKTNIKTDSNSENQNLILEEKKAS